ncbi:MAG TPA: NUDIX hydrolase [Candidatus Hydrogenedentes bacterium]|nr:NUDIX hydrolase [Candidatus Hydrogenedentota bacterium]HQH66850.1 NUDIX hydrolase [Candidatus Hydrogenedentota bacterium]HQM48716.1 NUDIX hydrolase [Candidatus Hydrogenedentota bacterium]
MHTKSPWKIKSSRLVYETPWLRVLEDQVVRPDGADGIYSYIETRVAVGAVALTPDNEVYLIGQYRYPTRQYSWEIVEGGAEPGEQPLACIQRELQEEAGLKAAKWTPLGGEIHFSNCISAERGLLFLAEDLEKTEASPEGTEVLEVRTMPFEDAVAMVHRGEIQDVFSIVGLLRAHAFLARRTAD